MKIIKRVLGATWLLLLIPVGMVVILISLFEWLSTGEVIAAENFDKYLNKQCDAIMRNDL